MSTTKRNWSNVGNGSGSSQDKKRKVSRPLDGFFGVAPPQRPKLMGQSEALYDVDSIFIAYAMPAENAHDINKYRNYVVEVANPEFRDDPADHVAHGARFLGLKAGKSGLAQTDFEVKLHSENDGEARAGSTIIETLSKANACDVVVFMCRWFGGTMLGPRRFEDISKVALEALHNLRDVEELAELRKTLAAYDNEIDGLLKRLAKLEDKDAPPQPTPPDYNALDITKARRIAVARTLRISNLQGRIKRLEEDGPASTQAPQGTSPKESPRS